VLHRPKQGFALPLVHWIRHELKDLINTILLDARTLQRGYFKERGIRQLLEEHFSGRRNHSGRIWRLLVFELWHRNYLERVLASAATVEPYRFMPVAEILR
jgi:asparagine synthase (glutamine-hydrolysing)